MSFFLRYSLPDRSWKNFLKLIDCHLPESKYSTKHRFFKRFPKIKEFDKHYYCAICEDYLEILNNEQLLCACEAVNNKKDLEKKENYFLTGKISEKLKDILTDKNVVSHLRKSDASGVTSGRIYKTLQRNGVIGENDITLQFNTDGANIFKSSRKSL